MSEPWGSGDGHAQSEGLLEAVREVVLTRGREDRKALCWHDRLFELRAQGLPLCLPPGQAEEEVLVADPASPVEGEVALVLVRPPLPQDDDLAGSDQSLHEGEDAGATRKRGAVWHEELDLHPGVDPPGLGSLLNVHGALLVRMTLARDDDDRVAVGVGEGLVDHEFLS